MTSLKVSSHNGDVFIDIEMPFQNTTWCYIKPFCYDIDNWENIGIMLKYYAAMYHDSNSYPFAK